ncbi:hypothetical protein Q5H93_03435 [Hymenobacter sp. ASUV-10]|uniref:SMI1/KNR4 family protein n=1 Tax=Hymenobacter aranciens TaxID=3063996 RepID=A0ABT9B667_9BACT|nr:hypothetical protein [Hymenobacter sp. ASUV-10]MDO7873771.1 hypothetical protein [Hymenobacter sp. ASUV-10]
MALDYLEILRTISGRADYYESDPPRTYATPKRPELGKLVHPEWLPDQLYAFLSVFNGYTQPWHTETTLPEGPALVSGRIDIQRLQDICASWEGIVYFEEFLQAPDAPAEQQRLRDFKVVDMYNDESAVGLYLTAARDPELYRCSLGEELPEPLGVDFDGYLQLLTLSLGHSYGTVLMRELHLHFTTQPDQPFAGPSYPASQIFVVKMTAVLPEFSLDAFVHLYDQVRLRR